MTFLYPFCRGETFPAARFIQKCIRFELNYLINSIQRSFIGASPAKQSLCKISPCQFLISKANVGRFRHVRMAAKLPRRVFQNPPGAVSVTEACRWRDDSRLCEVIDKCHLIYGLILSVEAVNPPTSGWNRFTAVNAFKSTEQLWGICIIVQRLHHQSSPIVF